MTDMRLPAALIIFYFLIFNVSFSQVNAEEGEIFLSTLMKAKMPRYSYIFSNPSKYRVQVIYTRIDRNEHNKAKLSTFYYRNHHSEFTNPASIVKLPMSLLALEKLKILEDSGVTRDTRYSTDCTFRCQQAIVKERYAHDSVPRLSVSITAALVVSDNESCNRLYEFLGQREINHRMWELGYTGSRIIQRFSPCDTIANRHTNGFSFFNEEGHIIYRQFAGFNDETFPKPSLNMVVGRGYIDKNNRKIKRGMDFSTKNHLQLYQVDDILKRVIFPDLYSENKRFRVSSADLKFIRRLLALRPAETGIAALSVKENYPDAITNYLFYGGDEKVTIPENIRIFNIVGQSYGFLTDCSYYIDFEQHIEFFLCATIYVNNDGILNDGKYEYQSIGFPFLKLLGQIICEYELHRKVLRQPDLSTFEKLFTP